MNTAWAALSIYLFNKIQRFNFKLFLLIYAFTGFLSPVLLHLYMQLPLSAQALAGAVLRFQISEREKKTGLNP